MRCTVSPMGKPSLAVSPEAASAGERLELKTCPELHSSEIVGRRSDLA
jgi:hypothetical protein